MSESERQTKKAQSEALFDTLLNQLGGFSKYQVFIFAVCISCVNGFNIIVYDLSFLEKMPEEFYCRYEDIEQEVKCVPDDFCGDPTLVSYRPNMELDDSFYNWIS